MEKISSNFQFKTLSRAENENAYYLYKAALEWNLVDPIVIENADDFKSKQEWREKLEPYHHQVTNLITFCRRLPVTLLADDVGLGKTISAGLIASELISRNRISKILIVCPKILMPQWKEELDLKFGIKSVEAIGRELIDVKLPSDSGAVITTYHSAKAYLDIIAEKGYQMLILDEAHKLRNLYGTNNAPQVATRFQKALIDRMFKYVLMLTATPIHNRLWDIYSLVDLLATARGHKNPFGTEGMFARNYILDSRTQARQLVPQNKDEFRKIVYSYMYRTRRAEVKLYFPERKVQLHYVNPTSEEIELINTIAEPIQELNPLVQVNLLQALVSSPHAFLSQLKNMGLKGTVDHSLVNSVEKIVGRIKISAKLEGLRSLISELRKKQGETWRMVIFTERLETQTTIEIFLQEQGISCGLINGSSGSRNQQTIEKFKKEIPEINVIISTRAGSEGVNLQASNILVNYDLPWNPMIVEQRIGRIQRLASNHKNVIVFNMILKGTFEEYIVGRLMEKLQMASHAIGDIDALLEAAGVDEERGFEEKIRQLVIDSLAGKDVEKATQLTAKSIENAKIVLKEEEDNMNRLLGSSGDVVEMGPRCPKLPQVSRSMNIKDFTLDALENKNIKLIKEKDEVYYINHEGRNKSISFNNGVDENVIVCKPGVPFFERLVTDLVNNPLHLVSDLDDGDVNNSLNKISNNWVTDFDGSFISYEISRLQMCFFGKAALRVNITVAHDSYERLIEIDCDSKTEISNDVNFSESMSKYLRDPEKLGLSVDYLSDKVLNDEAVFEFCRFYQERLVQELKSVGNDSIKRKKMEDDFTPHVEISLVGLEGNVHRNVETKINYSVDGDHVYSDFLLVTPKSGDTILKPEIKKCEDTGLRAPADCFEVCCVSKKHVLKHLLRKSEVSNKMALEKYFTVCALTGKNILIDESQVSDITGKNVTSKFLKTSVISGKKGEPEFFDKCQFTDADVLKEELSCSQISGKKYRNDQEEISSISGKRGHKQEFVVCAETGVYILPSESEKCEQTGKVVAPGILQRCEVSNKRVIPSELVKSSISGKMALKKFFVHSSLSDAQMLEDEAIRSNDGSFCTPTESRECKWSNEKYHPKDLVIDSLSGLPMHFSYIEKDRNNSFKVLISLLDGGNATSEGNIFDNETLNKIYSLVGNSSCEVEASEYSLNRNNIALCLKVKSLFGLKIRYYGLIFSITSNNILGNISVGKRDKKIWLKSK